MAEKKSRTGGNILKFFAIIAILGVVVAAVIVKGFEHGDIKLNTQNLWVLHKSIITTGKDSKASYYGQVNPGLGELTSVNSVTKEPGSILESEYGAELFGTDMTMADINLAAPQDFAKESKAFITPIDSTSASIAGKVIAFYGATKGTVSYTTIVEGKTSTAQSIGRPSSLTNGSFAAAAVSSAGTIFAFSPDTAKVYSFDTNTGQWVGSGDDAAGASSGTFELTSVGEKWVLVDTQGGRSWVRGVAGNKTFTPTSSLKLQASSGSGAAGYFSTDSGLYSINLSGGDIKEVATSSGANSQPIYFEGNIYSAWLNETSGELFNGASGQKLALSGFGGAYSLGASIDPVFQSNGTAAILNDAESGWAWNIDDGSVIPSTQDWKSKIVPPPPVINGGQEAKKQEPPKAVDDEFGARPDTLTTLPVLLNDTDPNPEDVLTIDPASVSGWDSSKGTLRISADGQSFSLLAPKTVTGSTSFSYRVSDGSQAHGTLSKNAATVTVTFVSGARNNAPVWCSDAPTPCTEREAPTASVLPGQSVAVNFVDGFIDPEGDKVFISDASVAQGTGSVGFDAKGEVVFRSNLSKGASETAKVAVTVSDTFGATTTKTMSIKVAANTELGFKPFVATTVVGQTKVVDILRGVTGAYGQVNLVSATRAGVNYPIVSPTAFSVTSDTAEQLQIAIKFTDENGVPASSYVQVNVIDDSVAKIAVSPVTVLVRAGLDSTVDLYSAITNPSERSLIISDVSLANKVGASTLLFGKVKGGNLRIRGATEDQSAGRIGTITYKVSDGTSDSNYAATGQIFVYQVASASLAPIGVDDSITLRAGATGDLDALANDVGTPGISLALDARNVTCKGTGFDENQGLVFAAHGVLRVIAPTKPDVYHCSYTLYSSDSPSLKSVANFTVNVTSASSNKAPIAPTVQARVTSYATIEIPIPLNGIDPDGDTVHITSVGASSQGKGFATISAKGNSVFYTVVPGSEGQDSFTYSVSDGFAGNEGRSTGVVKVGIFGKYATGGPVTMVDVVDLVAGSNGKAVFDPTANDFDPNGKGLKLVVGSVKPNLKEGTDAYKTSAALVTQPESAKTKLVTIVAPSEVSQLDYVYSVSDGFGNVSLGSILVRVTKKAIPDNPEVLDTFVEPKDRSSLSSAGVDVVTDKVNWLTGDASKLTLSLVGNTHGFRVKDNQTLVGTPPSSATFVVFKLSGTNYSKENVYTYGILHIPADSRIITLKDYNQVWNVNEGATEDQDLLNWISVPAGANVEIDAKNVQTAPNGRAEARCSFKSGTTITYSAGTGGTKFNDVCVVPVRYVGDKDYSLVPIRIHVKANNPEPLFNNVTVEVMPGSTSTVDLRSMVSWDSSNPTFDWKVSHSSGSSISATGPTADSMTFSVVPGSEARDQDVFTVRIGNYTTSGTITVVVGESPNAKPTATLTFDNKSCNIKLGTCALHVSDLTGVVNAFPQPLQFMPFGFGKGTSPNYKAGQVLTCLGVKIKVTDANTVTAVWDVKKGVPTTQTCPTLLGPGGLLDAEGKKGVLKITVDLQGVPLAPLRVEQVGFSQSTVTIRIKAGDFSVGDNQVTSYNVYEAGKKIATCNRVGDETVTTCDKIEDLKPYHGNDKENLHTFSVKAVNSVGESAACIGSGIYAYEKLRAITPDVIDAHTVLGRETATDMGVLAVTLTPRVDPLAAKYVITGDGGTSAHTEVIAGDYKARNFQISAKPGTATLVTVRAEGAIPAPVQGSIDNSSTSINVRVSGAPDVGATAAAIVGDSAPYFGKITLHNANRKYSVRPSKIAYVFWPGDKSPACNFDEPTNTLTVEQVAGEVVKYAEERQYNDQLVDLSSPDVPGLSQNVTYHAKACYSNGFKVAESVAPNTLSTIQDPNDGDFEYKVQLESATQSSGAYLYSWVVKLAKQQTPAPGMKVQFAGDKANPNQWSDTFSSTYWGERPIIKVRYCNLAGTICSAGQTLVKPQDDTMAWQIRIKRAFITDDKDVELPNATCTPASRQYIKFGAEGDGIAGWEGAVPDDIVSGQFGAEYQLDGSTTWSPLDSSSYFLVKKKAQAIKKMRFWFQPHGGSTSGLDKVQVTLDVTC